MINEIVKAIEEKIEHRAEVTATKVTKPGGVVRNEISIREPGARIAPTIYIDEAVQRGMTVDEVADWVIEVSEKNPITDIEQIVFKAALIEDFEKAKENLSYMLINKESSKEYLEDKVYRDLFDLAAVPYVKVGKFGTIVVRKNLLKVWNVCEDEVMNTAISNLVMNFPYEIDVIDMCDALINEMEKNGMGEVPEELKELIVTRGVIYIVTNKKRRYGAPYGFIPSVMEHIAKKMDSDLFILPSSVDEVLVISADDEDIDSDHARKVVREVNIEALEPQERLSNNIYKYSRATGEIEIV